MQREHTGSGDELSETAPQTIDDQLAVDILAAVEASFEAQTIFTQDLIRHPSLRGREHTCQEFIFRQLAARATPFLANNPPEVEFNGFFAEGYVLEEDSDAEQTLTHAHVRAFGTSLQSFVTPGYLDGRVFVLYDDCPCLVYGPCSENIHAFDERVSLASVKRITGTIALFIAEWCGLEPA